MSRSVGKDTHWHRLQRARQCAQTRCGDHHSAANANQVPNKNWPEIIDFRPVLGFPGSLSKPPPFARRRDSQSVSKGANKSKTGAHFDEDIGRGHKKGHSVPTPIDDDSVGHCEKWSGWRDSNPRPLDPQSSALPGCATSRLYSSLRFYDERFRRREGRGGGDGRDALDSPRPGAGSRFAVVREVAGRSAGGAS
jgi:hypothetical protein